MRRSHRTQAGFTFIEVAIANVVLLMLLGTMTSLLSSTDALSKTSHRQTRVVSEHRRNLESLSSVLRLADIGSLGGFDSKGRATTPTFRRVTGVDLEGRVLADQERIVWRAGPRPVDGVENPGSLWLVSTAEERLVADRVPLGTFELRQEGAVLAIGLTTYYAVEGQEVALISSETAVTLRN